MEHGDTACQHLVSQGHRPRPHLGDSTRGQAPKLFFFSTVEKRKKENGLLPVLDPLQISESHTSVPWKERDGSFAGLSGRVDVWTWGWGRVKERQGTWDIS